MRHAVLPLLCLILVLGGPSSCATLAPLPPDAGLDALLARLRATRDPAEAKRLEARIFRSWASSGRPAVDAMMDKASSSLDAGEYDMALAILDAVVVSAPDYVEGWDLRATTHYLRGEYGPAMSDLGHVLALEPRHFAALAELGHVLLALDDKKAALRAFQSALTLDPHLGAIREQADALADEVEGTPI